MKTTQWTGYHDNEWMPVPDTTPVIKPGIFEIGHGGPLGWHLSEITPKHDAIVRLGVSDYIYTNIVKFYEAKSRYLALGLLHKRGFLLYGPPGTGKSIAAAIVCSEVVKNKGIALVCKDTGYPPVVCSHIRTLHSELPIMCLWEDIEQWCEAGGDEDDRAQMTSFLDGEHQINGIVHVATTNKFERLDPAFANRPGRFDDVVFVGAPSEKERHEYLSSILPKSEEKLIAEMAAKSDGLLLSHLKDCLVSVFVLGHGIDQTVSRFKQMIGRDKQLEEERHLQEKERLAGQAQARQTGKQTAKAFQRLMGR